MSILDSLRPIPDLRVLVAAGAGGVGAAIARAFHAAGSRVHVCDVDRSALDRLRAEAPGITGSMADVSRDVDVAAVFEDVQEALGGLDVLVGNGVIAGPAGPVDSIDAAGWERAIAVNVHGQFHCARRAVPLLKRSRTGATLIMTASPARPARGGSHAAQASGTGAITALVRSLALELGPHGVRVNAILLGAGTTRDQVAGSSVSTRRSATAAGAAALALFLSSPAARGVTGQAIAVE